MPRTPLIVPAILSATASNTKVKYFSLYMRVCQIFFVFLAWNINHIVMSKAKKLYVSESVIALKKLLSNRSVTIINRIKMLILLKSNEGEDFSKHRLGKLLGVSSSSVQIWRKLYENGGISLLLEDKRIGFKPSLISAQEHEQIEAKLHDPSNGLRGYVELQEWISREFDKTITYNTLLKYCGPHFGSKSKVARKSHVKKDLQAVEDLKKTSDKSAERSMKPTRANTSISICIFRMKAVLE
jgi:transposase